MKLRCLGGINDGEWHEVERYYRIGDFIRIWQPNQYEASVNFEPSKIPEMVYQRFEIYKISQFCFSKDDNYKFLVPRNWTDKEAILHQLRK